MSTNNNYIFKWSNNHSFPSLSVFIFLFSLVGLFVLQYKYYHSTYSNKDLEVFQETLNAKEALVAEEFDRIIQEAENGDIKNQLDKESLYLSNLSEEKDVCFFYFEDRRMLFWSDHTVPVRRRWTQRRNSVLMDLKNATYVTVIQPVEHGTLLGLVLVRTHYEYENEYLISAYQKDFKLSPDVELSYIAEEGYSQVFNKDGEFLFSLGLEGKMKNLTSDIVVALFLSLLAFVSLFIFLALMTDKQLTKRGRSSWLVISSLSVLLYASAIVYLKLPSILYEAELFQPGIFASRLFSSMGHLWVFILMVLMLVLFVYWFFDRSKKISGKLHTSIAIGLHIIATFWFVFMHHLGKILVLDSNLSFEFFKLNSLSVFTFLALIILVLAFVSFVLIIIKEMQYFSPDNKWFVALLGGLGLVLLCVFLFVEKWHLEWSSLIFYLLFCAAIFYLMAYSSERPRFSRFFIILIIFSIFITIDLLHHTSDKLESQKEIELAKLSSEHDAVAEMLFRGLSSSLRSDSLLVKRLAFEIIEIDLVYEYLQRNYFSGYWTKYDMQITLCRPPDSVFVESPVDDWFHCYNFFDDLVGAEGLKVEGTDFYFLNNLNGRISYLGIIPYMEGDREINLFLELDSKISSEELGYPGLLMKEESFSRGSFSYAKFNRGELITSAGSYSYRLRDDYYTQKKETFEKLKEDGYDHTIFNVDTENTVIVSYESITIVDKIISFSYIFALVFILFALSYSIVLSPHLRRTMTWDFKNKIQYSVIGVLFFTFIVICTGTIYFVIQQYQIKHTDNLENTMRSLYIELVHKVEFEENLRNWSSDSYYNLDELLRKFSNVFYTDINMYDPNGILLATSRSEVFDQQLLSLRMNREAFEKLSMESYSSYIQTERIGKMTYQSAYVPLLNSENRLLAYMNLPYFTQPEVLAQEVTNLVVAILNTYVILMLFILFITVFLADRITQPLRFIQSRIAQLNLSKSNEKIVYSGRDEVAGLVKEYNSMVEELQKSAELLAQSERESAWREMAKQIAHEIKNPLTPMKLNVQHLQRMITEGKGNIEEQVEKVSLILIEQIDSLTLIANEFSDFAKMPKAKNRDINLLVKLENVVSLFENSEGVHIDIDTSGLSDVRVYGDSEQFQRVLINLVKNGIQSIPDDREKKINISLEEAPEDTVIIAVTDNGKGIPSDIQDKLFQPNFTTKSSGMGMGLAISSNIIKTMNGNVWYSTKEGEGTTFYIKLPLATE